MEWLGSSMIAAGAEYRLCWCAAGPFPCSVWEDFSVDLGALTLLGPSPLSQHRTCVSGRTCDLSRLRGTGVGAADAIFVLETCGAAAAVPGVPIPIGPAAALSAQGGEYRLCWCSEGLARSLAPGELCDLTVDAPRPESLRKRGAPIAGGALRYRRASRPGAYTRQGQRVTGTRSAPPCSMPPGRFVIGLAHRSE